MTELVEMDEKEPMTILGQKMLKDELKHLISVERPNVVAAIEEARGHGDLSENAEYDAAKDRQGMIEAKISMIQDRLARAEVINPSDISSEKVIFGATVTLFDVSTEKPITYQIVGEDEADIKKSKISIKSPIARALIGKREDDEISFKAPGGLREYVIEKIEYH